MIRIAFLGFGNLGFNLCNALYKRKNISVNQIYNRSKIELPKRLKSIPFTTNLSDLISADVYIMAIPDDAIESFSESLPFNDKLVVHTSGAAAMTILSEKNRKGVFYPLQTFSKNRKAKFKKIPICIEADNEADLVLLKEIGSEISKKVIEITSEEREKLHLAAVFVNNFVNHMYTIGHDLLKEHDLNFDLLKPLIKETAGKIEHLSPIDAQTGPAKRDDKNTIEKHLHLLETSQFKGLYQQITESIKTTHGKKL